MGTRGTLLGGWVGIIGLASFLASACDAQEEPGYSGEALIHLDAIVEPTSRLADADLAALQWRLRWIDLLGPVARFDIDPLGSAAEFPDRFDLSVLNRPPTRSMNDLNRIAGRTDEPIIGIAMIETIHRYTFARQVLVYIDRDIAQYTVGEAMVGGLLEAGFHLLEVVDAPCDSYLPADDPADRLLDCLRPLPDDLHGVVELQVGDPSASEPPAEYPTLFQRSPCVPTWEPCEP